MTLKYIQRRMERDIAEEVSLIEETIAALLRLVMIKHFVHVKKRFDD